MMLPSPTTYVLKPILRVPTPSTPHPSAPEAHQNFTENASEPGGNVQHTPEIQLLPMQTQPHVVSQRGNAWYFHDVARISRFFSANKYTCFVQDGSEHIATESLSSLERRLETFGFMRTHRACLINLAHVRMVRRIHNSFEVTLADGQIVQASRRLVRALRDKLAF